MGCARNAATQETGTTPHRPDVRTAGSTSDERKTGDRLTAHSRPLFAGQMKESVMAESNDNPGLCTTCNNAPSCFHRVRRGPAQFCETFDGYVPPLERSKGLVPTPAAEPPMAARASEEDASTYAGLCMNCRHRRTCRHPGRERGVWHCEDYD